MERTFQVINPDGVYYGEIHYPYLGNIVINGEIDKELQILIDSGQVQEVGSS